MNLPIRAVATPFGARPGTIARRAVGLAITVGGLLFLMARLGEALVHSRAALEAGLAAALATALGALAAALSAQVIGTAPVLYPIGLAVAAGAMLFVVSHEIIPGTHRRGGESIATLGLTLGFTAMLVIDSSFV